jgi:hypothetical protein
MPCRRSAALDGGALFVVHHYDIGLTDLRASDLRVQMAKGQATLMALKQIENRQGGGFAQEFGSVEDGNLSHADGEADDPARRPAGSQDLVKRSALHGPTCCSVRRAGGCPC